MSAFRLRTPYVHPFRTALIVPVSACDSANVLIRGFDGASESYQPVKFDIPLSATGETPVTHVACCGPASRRLVVCLQDRLRLGLLPALRWYRWEIAPETLIDSNSPRDRQLRHRRPWNWHSVLTDTGLRVVEKELDRYARR